MKRLAFLCSLSLLSASTIFAAVSGAIFTTVQDGTTVNGNIYSNKEDVFLNGGPQNDSSAGLDPDGLYYFQVTDPSGEVLLSTDPLSCRILVVANGRVAGQQASAACATPHANGAFNAANATTPVQLMPYLDTPNNGGEYKAWITPVGAYDLSCDAGHRGSHGFCDQSSKTDNFKVRSSSSAAYVQVCKFNDYNHDGRKDGAEPFIAHWPIAATTAAGEVQSQTDDLGCTSFTVTGFTSERTAQEIVISEGTFGLDWQQTAPIDCGDVANCSVDGGKITMIVRANDNVVAPAFGNSNPYCREGCDGGEVIATADAYPSLVKTFGWSIDKVADHTRIRSASPRATAGFTVTVSHDAGTDSDWKLAGEILIANPGGTALSGMTLTAATDLGGACDVSGGSSAAIAAGSHAKFAYHCAFASAPSAGTVKVAGSIDNRQVVAASAPFNFESAVANLVDEEVSISDPMATPSSWVVSADMASPSVTAYSVALNGAAGTCSTMTNTASMRTNDTQAVGSASKTVQLCVGANVLISQTAATSFETGITKRVDRAVVQQQGGSITFNYTVGVTERAWIVSGNIHLVNPNDWQAVTVNLSEAVPGASCTVASSIVVPASQSVDVPYSCAFASAPASSQATASISWDASAAFTPDASAQAVAAFTFASLTIVDAFNGGAPTTLGTIEAPVASRDVAYSQTVANAAAGTCKTFTNTASVAGTEQSASQPATACNTLTGARTIGFWQNKNGQALITGGASSAAVCNVTNFLRLFTPFQDLAANASCKTTAAYATTVIKNASAAGAAMNAMLKAQMLATALDVFYSDAALSGNTLQAPASVGATKIQLTDNAFGTATSLTVMQMLLFQNGVSNVGGTVWYGQDKAVQGLAKNAFDAINNEVARIAQ